MKIQTIMLTVISLVLGACATLSEEECHSVDWYALGESDALAGYPEDYVEQHAKSCNKFGIGPDAAAWQAGYRHGLIGFCVPQKGFDLGLRNGEYHGQCPTELDWDFSEAYRIGQRIHDVEERISAAESEISRLREQIKDPETGDAARESAGTWLDYYKDERDDYESDRADLFREAREMGLSAW